jgi:hypothetical protein
MKRPILVAIAAGTVGYSKADSWWFGITSQEDRNAAIERIEAPATEGCIYPGCCKL